MERKPYSGSAGRGNAAPSRSRSAAQPRASQNRSAYRPQDSYGRPSQNAGRPSRPAQHSDVRRNPNPHRKRRKKSTKDFVPLLLLLCAVVALAVFFIRPWISAKTNDSTYYPNVYVNGIELDQFDRETGKAVVAEQFYQRLNHSYTLTCQGQSWSFKPSDFGAAINADSYLERAWNIGHIGGIFEKQSVLKELSASPVHFNAPLEYNADLIDAFLAPIAEAVYIAPVDAQVTLDIDRPYLSGESSLGRELDTEAAKQLICALIETGEGETELPVKDIQPAISSDNAEGGLNVIVEFKTDTTFRRSDARRNISKALSYFNALAVYPGDTVSFNDVVGPRTEERGFRPAAEYVGNKQEEGIGGGVCQASSTLYCATMLAGMDIIERHNHSMTVSYTEPSLDAAVSEERKDFVFQNNTDHAIYIYTHVDREFATVTIYGNRTDYRYELYSNITRQEAECRFTSYLPDEEGKHVYYTTETYVHTAGHPALASEGWIISYDWETGDEVERHQLSFDIYESGTNIYWRGIHDPVSGEVVDYSNW